MWGHQIIDQGAGHVLMGDVLPTRRIRAYGFDSRQ